MITFEKQTYVHTDKNYGDPPKLQLIYPEEYDDSLQIFPISVAIDEVDITATGQQLQFILNALVMRQSIW